MKTHNVTPRDRYEAVKSLELLLWPSVMICAKLGKNVPYSRDAYVCRRHR